jgi:hypothetical protein
LALIVLVSLSGLFAARVLDTHFTKVVVIEPDTELEHKRSRVGQWNQAHSKEIYSASSSLALLMETFSLVFLSPLRLICLRLFPGFDDEVLKSGLLLRTCDYNLQMEGKTCQVDSSALPPVIASCRIG